MQVSGRRSRTPVQTYVIIHVSNFYKWVCAWSDVILFVRVAVWRTERGRERETKKGRKKWHEKGGEGGNSDKEENIMKVVEGVRRRRWREKRAWKRFFKGMTRKVRWKMRNGERKGRVIGNREKRWKEEEYEKKNERKKEK